jgi:CHASE2 domain-containing sensor protein
MRIFYALLLAVPLFAAEPDAHSRFITVALTAGDIEQFGGWPIPRRWYANFIQKAEAEGAAAISIDIAFVTADPLHPESDEYFYEVLMQYPNVSLACPRFHPN